MMKRPVTGYLAIAALMLPLGLQAQSLAAAAEAAAGRGTVTCLGLWHGAVRPTGIRESEIGGER